MKICDWAKTKEEIEYHNNEWGRITKDDKILFEYLVLEWFQAGLNWNTILRKRDAMRIAFDNFDVEKISQYTEEKEEELLLNKNIIRHKLKIKALKNNAKAFIEIKNEYGSFYNFLNEHVNKVDNFFRTYTDVKGYSNESEILSKELKKRGFKFLGKTIVYSFMQACGIVNDHILDCEIGIEIRKKR